MKIARNLQAFKTEFERHCYRQCQKHEEYSLKTSRIFTYGKVTTRVYKKDGQLVLTCHMFIGENSPIHSMHIQTHETD